MSAPVLSLETRRLLWSVKDHAPTLAPIVARALEAEHTAEDVRALSAQLGGLRGGLEALAELVRHERREHDQADAAPTLPAPPPKVARWAMRVDLETVDQIRALADAYGEKPAAAVRRVIGEAFAALKAPR